MENCFSSQNIEKKKKKAKLDTKHKKEVSA